MSARAPVVLAGFFLAVFPRAVTAAETVVAGNTASAMPILGVGVLMGIALALIVLSLRRIRDHGRALKEGGRFRDVADFVGDWVWEMDTELRFTYLSARFLNFFRLPRKRSWAKPAPNTSAPPLTIRFGKIICGISTPNYHFGISNTPSPTKPAADATSASAAGRCSTPSGLSRDIREPAPI